MNTLINKSKGGRPPKFAEASRPITVTLPERTLRQLTAINPDRAKAIASLAESASSNAEAPAKAVDIVEIASGKAIILVGPSTALHSIHWLRLIEVAPHRFLLVVPSGKAIESLEVALMDLIEGLPKSKENERSMLEELRNVISHHRRHDGVSRAEMLFVNI
jgi:hypothetical protein